jgi:hypothetical protein
MVPYAIPLGQWEIRTMEILNHGALITWGFGTMGIWDPRALGLLELVTLGSWGFWTMGAFGPRVFRTMGF